MLIEIKKPITKAKLEKASKALKKRKKKGFDPEPFLGKINWKGDGLAIQQKMRNEWS